MGIRGNGISVAQRHGRKVIRIDFRYTDSNGIRRRFKRDASLQSMQAAKAESDRLQKIAAETGSPEGASDVPHRFAPIERVPASQGVYFIHLEPWPDRVKIGYASNIERRVFHLDHLMPAPVCVVAVKLGATLEDEAAFHRRFSRVRIRGEWFRMSEGLAKLIAELREASTP
jgi:hypothetical protein